MSKKKKKKMIKEKKESIMAKKGEIKNVIVTKKKTLYYLFCKEVAMLTNTPNIQNLLSCVEIVLQEFEDLFPKEV